MKRKLILSIIIFFGFIGIVRIPTLHAEVATIFDIHPADPDGKVIFEIRPKYHRFDYQNKEGQTKLEPEIIGSIIFDGFLFDRELFYLVSETRVWDSEDNTNYFILEFPGHIKAKTCHSNENHSENNISEGEHFIIFDEDSINPFTIHYNAYTAENPNRIIVRALSTR
ncbi:MAG: hypothetical protein HYS98_06055 [Deltaproteobacteria bacterium]|nr:hypothetical protein [Deltaproteobacteria bacterium]